MENMKEYTEVERLKIEIVILKKKIAFSEGIIKGLLKE